MATLGLTEGTKEQLEAIGQRFEATGHLCHEDRSYVEHVIMTFVSKLSGFLSQRMLEALSTAKAEALSMLDDAEAGRLTEADALARGEVMKEEFLVAIQDCLS